MVSKRFIQPVLLDSLLSKNIHAESRFLEQVSKYRGKHSPVTQVPVNALEFLYNLIIYLNNFTKQKHALTLI